MFSWWLQWNNMFYLYRFFAIVNHTNQTTEMLGRTCFKLSQQMMFVTVLSWLVMTEVLWCCRALLKKFSSVHAVSIARKKYCVKTMHVCLRWPCWLQMWTNVWEKKNYFFYFTFFAHLFLRGTGTRLIVTCKHIVSSEHCGKLFVCLKALGHRIVLWM